MREKPNIFSYATKELSQDAFIAWLIEWADKSNVGEPLHNCGLDLMNAFLKVHSKDTLSNPTIEIKMQEYVSSKKRFIDILCKVIESDTKYVLLIEDKVGTSDGAQKLIDYVEHVKNHKDYQGFDVIPVYFKTSSQSNFSAVEKAGYKKFLRPDFLKILKDNKEKIHNDIFDDYLKYLQKIDDSYEYESIEQNIWRKNNWIGFFEDLQKEFDGSGFKNVSNAKGSFLGFYFAKQINNNIDNYKIYLQLNNKENSISIRLAVKKGEKVDKKIRITWKKYIQESGSSYGIKLPSRIAPGRTTRVGIFQDEFLVLDNKHLDLNKTINKLKDFESLLKEIVQKLPNTQSDSNELLIDKGLLLYKASLINDFKDEEEYKFTEEIRNLIHDKQNQSLVYDQKLYLYLLQFIDNSIEEEILFKDDLQLFKEICSIPRRKASVGRKETYAFDKTGIIEPSYDKKPRLEKLNLLDYAKYGAEQDEEEFMKMNLKNSILNILRVF